MYKRGVMNFIRTLFLLMSSVLYFDFSHASVNPLEKQELEYIYQQKSIEPSDVNEHLAHLRQLASECSSVIEIGVGTGQTVSVWGILRGLSESQNSPLFYGRIDLASSSEDVLQRAQELAESQGISVRFWCGNEMTMDIHPVDMIFIDSVHTYCHLTFELEKFSSKVCKYIAMHDTSAPWGLTDDAYYQGDYSEYDPSFDRTKHGLWPAVVDFLKRHPEWSLYQNKRNNYGFTVLKRTEQIAKEKEIDPRIDFVLKNKIILCTGPSFNRKVELKAITENDMKFIPFKKIFLSTNDPRNADVVFEQMQPMVELLEPLEHLLDCMNCITTSIKNAVNDPSCQDDDIILFKHESVFIDDMYLVRGAIGKILEGYDAVTRWKGSDWCDVFFIKVSSARELFANKQLISSLEGYIRCEEFLTKTVFDVLPKLYRIFSNREVGNHYGSTELGLFHVSPGYKYVDWDKKNYNDLYSDLPL